MRNLLVLLMIGFSSVVYSQSTQQPFKITLSMAKPEVNVGDHVYIDLLMTNTSNQDVNCTIYAEGSLDGNYEYNVLDEDGQPPPKIVRIHPLSSAIYPCIIKPGESRSISGLISQLYYFIQPGKYTIQVTRGYEGSDDLVKSNTITITVLPADDPSAGGAGPHK